MKTAKDRSEQFESKAHSALHGHSTKLVTERQPSRWSAQRTRHTLWVGEERAPRNAAIELRSRFAGVLK